MMAAAVGPPVRAETAAAARSSPSSGLRSCPSMIPVAVTGRAGRTFGP